MSIYDTMNVWNRPYLKPTKIPSHLARCQLLIGDSQTVRKEVIWISICSQFSTTFIMVEDQMYELNIYDPPLILLHFE